MCLFVDAEIETTEEREQAIEAAKHRIRRTVPSQLDGLEIGDVRSIILSDIEIDDIEEYL